MAALAVALGFAPICLAADSVRTAKTTYSGTIEEITPQQITLRTQTGRQEAIPVNEVLSVRFDGEPTQLSSARNQMADGRYGRALEFLEKAAGDPAASGNERVAAEIEYYRAAAKARQAMVQGDAEAIRAAGGALLKWVDANGNSYHWYEANELLGDLLVALNAHDKALEYYSRVEQAPWPDKKMAALIAKGRALLAQGKVVEAEQAFAAAEQLPGDDANPLVARQRQTARLGRARCLADQQKYDEAIQAAQQVVAEADPEDDVLSARAYNTLGYCLNQAGRTKEALRAYLHVDLLYSTAAQEHAEALEQLARLWVEVDQPDRAVQAQNTLKQRYGS